MIEINKMKTIFLISSVLILSVVLFTDTSSFQSKAKKKKGILPARIHGKVAIILRSGDVKPIAKSWFVLLPFSVHEARVHYLPGNSEANNKEFLDTIEAKYLRAESAGRAFKFETDFDGKFEVNGIPPGRYCISDDSYRIGPRNWVIVSYDRAIGKSYIHWTYWVDLLAGENVRIDLSNENAREIMNIEP